MLNDLFKRHVKLFLLLAGLLLWAGFTRPLPLHFASAIPYSFRSPSAEEQLHGFVPGDHVQLLYHFWLLRDMATGGTPPFANVYEFNTGDDEGRKKFDPYYVPFSLVYAIVSPVLGHAAGWNASCLFSVLIGLYGFFLLSGRYTRSVPLAAAVSLVATAFPYRWICLLCGSPTGFAASLVPWLAYGLDRAVRERSARGGLVAGLALFASYCSDLHVFYFSALAAPCWCVFAWVTDGAPLRLSLNRVRGLCLALLPFVAFAGLAVALSAFASDTLDRSTMSGGRTLRELALFSPIRSGLFRWETLEGGANQIFSGTGLALLLLLGGGVWLRLHGHARSKEVEKSFRAPLAVLLLGLATMAVFWLALGTNGPFDAFPVKAARRLIPKYTMIRQTAKIFCLMPVLLAILGTILFRPLAESAVRRPRLVLLASLLAMAAVAEQILWFRPALSRLPATMPAYDLVARDASLRGVTAPRAVALPLWPGDSHWSSAYEYGVMGSRVRLLNGYSPSVPGDYFTGFFSKLESLNQGDFTASQRDLLLDHGIGYLLFHERPYPPKVSPFPARIAEERLLGSPWLREVAITNGVWAFRIVREQARRPTPPATRGIAVPAYEAFPASIQWPASRIAGRGGNPETATVYRLRLRAPASPAPGLRYKALASGGGTLRSDSGLVVRVPKEESWIDLPFTAPSGEEWHVEEGRPVLRYALLAAGDETWLPDASRREWAAAYFFHRGLSSPGDGSVLFSAADVPSGEVLHGPDLPLPPGRYNARIATSSADSAPRPPAGEFLASTLDGPGTILARSAVLPGETASIDFDYDGKAPLRLAFHYNRSGDISVRTIELTRR